MDRAFSIFGKLSLGILIASILIAGGIYLGIKKNSSSVNPTPSPIAQKSPSATIETSTPSAHTTASAESNQTVVITGTTPFSSFSVTIPNDWQIKKEIIVDRTRVTFSNGNTRIIISQAAGGGGKCVYPGETPSDFSSSFTNPVKITGKSGQFTRGLASEGSIVNGIQTFTICALKADSTNQFPTQFGYIDYESAPNPSDSVLSKLDQIVASIKKQ